MKTKLIIETYIAYELCSGEPVYVKEELYPLINFANNNKSTDESKDKFIYRCKKDLIRIGFLKEDARRHIRRDSPVSGSQGIVGQTFSSMAQDTDGDLGEKISIFTIDECQNKLIPYEKVPYELQKIYKIVKMLNTVPKDSDDETYRCFIESYFSNGLERTYETNHEISELFDIIRLTIWMADELADKTGESIDRKIFNTITDAVLDIKKDIGFYPVT